MINRKPQFNTRRTYNSRIAQKQKVSNLRTIVIMSFLTVLLLSSLLYGGVNLFIKLASWWADKQTVVSNEQNDTIPPATPRLVITNRVVKDPIISLIGFSEPESEISIFNNDQPISKVIADSNGQFSISDVTLILGENKFNVKANDKSGNYSNLSNPEIITFDNLPPKLEIESPKDGSDFRGAQNQTIEIRGITDENSRVWINEKLVIIGTGGSFVTTFRLNVGTQDILIKSIDSAGNETETTLKLSFSP